MTDHFKFCNVCKNKRWDQKNGIICNLNDQKPNFDKNCKDYKFSIDNFNDMVNDKREFYEKRMSRDLATSKFKIVVELTKKIEDHRIYSADRLPDKLEILHPFPLNFIFRKPVLTFDKNGIHRKGNIFNGWKFEYKEISIKWNEIICSSFHSEWEDRNKHDSKSEYLVIDTISNELSEKFYVHWNLRKKEVGHYIELFKEKYGVNN